MNLQDILRQKGALVHTISSQATLDDVVQKLVQQNCGSLVVCDSDCNQAGAMVGIITERDILKACAAQQGSLDQRRVSQVMSGNVITGSPGDRVEDVMGVMTNRRIRHLPVLDEGRLAGMVSIGDLVKAQHHEYAMENHYLKSYIQS
jgi:CBS domain-containing protein